MKSTIKHNYLYFKNKSWYNCYEVNRMKKVAILCHDGFEEVEALSPLDVLRRANVHCDLVGMDKLEVKNNKDGVTVSMFKEILPIAAEM